MTGLAPRIKSEVPWSTKRGNLSEKDQILKGMLNKLMPEKFDLLKGQLLDSGIFTADILKDVISLISRRTEMLNFAASYIKKTYDPMIGDVDSDVDSDPVRNVQQIGEVSALEKLTRYVDDRRVPVYFLGGSRAVNVILGRNLDDQFTREAFQFCCPDSHPFLRESKRSLCQEHPGFEIHEGMEDYVESKLWDLYIEYENMQELYDQIVSKRERKSPTSDVYLWETIDDGVEMCRTIRRQIRAAGGASHDIPPHLIRWD